MTEKLPNTKANTAIERLEEIAKDPTFVIGYVSTLGVNSQNDICPLKDDFRPFPDGFEAPGDMTGGFSAFLYVEGQNTMNLVCGYSHSHPRDD